MWVTVLVSQPSVSMETETTQRICSPSRPGRPTVFITSRKQRALAGLALRRSGALACREFALELLDLGAGGFPKSLVERVAGFDLAGVD